MFAYPCTPLVLASHVSAFALCLPFTLQLGIPICVRDSAYIPVSDAVIIGEMTLDYTQESAVTLSPRNVLHRQGVEVIMYWRYHRDEDPEDPRQVTRRLEMVVLVNWEGARSISGGMLDPDCHALFHLSMGPLRRTFHLPPNQGECIEFQFGTAGIDGIFAGTVGGYLHLILESMVVDADNVPTPLSVGDMYLAVPQRDATEFLSWHPYAQ